MAAPGVGSIRALNPRWITLLLIVAATAAATVVSFRITITPLDASPVFLVSASGMVLLARFGRRAWPAFALGDMIGEWVGTSRPASVMLVVVITHVLVALAGATWIVDHDAWPGDLRTSVRYVVGASALAIVQGLAFVAISYGLDPPPAGASLRNELLWVTVGVLVGFLVGGTFLAAWLRAEPSSTGPLRPALGLIAITGAAAGGLAGPISVMVPLALLGTLLLTSRAGRRWGGAALVIVAACAFVGAERGMAPMGGTGTAGELANVMVTLALMGGFVALLGGYRRAGQAASHPVATVALVFAGIMLVAGISGVGASAIVVADDAPLVVAGMFTAVSAIGLAILRSARPVDRPLHRRGAMLAACAGVLYALNLALYFGAEPLIGPGAATALAMISPLPVVILSVIFLRVRTSWGVMAGIAIIVGGALVAAMGSLSNPWGIALAVLSAVAFAGSVIVTRKALGQGGIIEIALISTASAAIVSLVAGVIVSGPGALLLPEGQVRAIALAALGAQLVPILGRTWALEHMGADLVGAEGVLGPASTGLLAFWLLTPPDAATQWIGLLVIAAGAVLAALAGGRVTRPAGPADP